MIKKKLQQGSVKRHPDGFGFFIPDDSEQPDVYVPRHSMKGVMTNDKVEVEVTPEVGGDRFRGDIVRIIERATKKVVGTYQEMNAGQGLIKDEGKGWGEDLKVAKEHSLGAKKGELVAVEILSFPDERKGFQGRVIEVLGEAMDPLTDIKRVLLNNNIPSEFSAAAEKEALSFAEHISAEDSKGRRDLSKLNFVTIDGATAKDFDDAVYTETTPKGFRLFVAIADVSHYVREGTAIDNDAYERGTSVYFPNFVVPMLPEVLSNGLCSLNPHLPRLALVAEMHIDYNGECFESEFYEAVFESKARVTYGEAQEMVDGNPMEKHSHVIDDVRRCADLAKILMAKRFREGSLDLEIPETQVIVDGQGIPTDIIKSERLFSHRVIEELMLAANVAVAKFFNAKEIPALYRIHEPPNQEAIALLEKYLWNFGSKTEISGGKLQKKLNKALEDFQGKPEAHILNILTLRSMSQAKYSQNNLGHFGLGFDNYTHFTSPIRRYPDLIVHRLIKSQITKNAGYRLQSEEDLATAGTMLSACEQKSVKAERQYVAIKKARFMEKFIDQEFEGLISSVTKFGAFVLLRNYEVDGLVRKESLATEKLDFDEETLTLYNPRTGTRFSIGDHVKIKVADADPETGQIDFQLIEKTFTAVANYKMPEAKETENRSRPSNKKGPRRSDRPGRSDRSEQSGRSERPEQSGRSARSGRTNRSQQTEKSAASTSESGRSKRSTSSRQPERNRGRTFAKSTKASAMDKNDSRIRDSALPLEKQKYYDENLKESDKSPGQFDPEAHFQKAMAKWQDRNGKKEYPDRRDSNRGIGARKQRSSDKTTDENLEKKSERTEKPRFFERVFKKSSDETKPKRSSENGPSRSNKGKSSAKKRR